MDLRKYWGSLIDQTHEKNCRPCHRWHSDGNKCRTPSAKFDVCIKDTKILISSKCEDQANSRLGILSSNIDWCKFYKIASERFFSSWPLPRISWKIATSYFDKSASSTKTMIDQYLLKSRCIKPSSAPGIRTRKKWVTNQEIRIYDIDDPVIKKNIKYIVKVVGTSACETTDTVSYAGRYKARSGWTSTIQGESGHPWQLLLQLPHQA